MPEPVPTCGPSPSSCRRCANGCALTGQPEQLTLVFDAGASSRQNLKGLADYVTALPPSRHAALLSAASDQLTEVALPTGAVVKAWPTRHLIAREQREIVVTYSPKLHAGQVRGLGQTIARTTAEIEELDADCARLSLEAVRQRMKKICARQVPRKLLQYEVTANEAGGSRRGSRLSGSEQKLRVHAFVCVMAYLLVTLLHRRAAIRCCRMIDQTGKRGRPRVRWQVEALHALPKLN